MSRPPLASRDADHLLSLNTRSPGARDVLSRRTFLVGTTVAALATSTASADVPRATEPDAELVCLERTFQQALDTLQRATGTAPVGWLGPEYGESARTPQLLAQAGIRYVCDWVNDEQPYAMKTSQGELYALPIMLELDDIHALWERFAENEPDGRYYHLEWWATRRDRRGEGLGTRLLREDLERVDADRLPAYLESTNPANLPRYEAYGFERVDEFGPLGGPTITTMWRAAR